MTVNLTGPAGRGAGSRPGQPIAGTRPPRSASAGDVVLAYLRLQAARLRSLEPAVRADQPDAVHQMRVAARRLRCTLRSFPAVLPAADGKRAAAELRWLGRLLAAARDAEVLSAHLRATLRSVPVELLIGPVQARVRGHYARPRADAHAAVAGALDSPRYVALLAELDRLTAEPPRGPQAGQAAGEVLPAVVGHVYRQARRRMRQAVRAPAGPARDAALHRARKAVRRARYAAEAARPAAGKPARRLAGQLKTVQSVAGQHQDTVLARRAARDLGIAAHLAGENAFSYGLLYEREQDRAARLQAAVRAAWQKAARRRYRRWIG